MLRLNRDLLIGQGTVRACYQHPEKPGLIVKVPTGDKSDREEANSRELKGYQILVQEHTKLRCISHCHGFISTNEGKGLICDGIYNDDGTISKSILDLITTEPPPDFTRIKNAVEQFCNYLLSNDVFVFDLNVKNIVLQEKNKLYHPYLIDLKSRYENKELIPFSRYIPYLSRKKLKRRCHQLYERTRSCWLRREELARSS